MSVRMSVPFSSCVAALALGLAIAFTGTAAPAQSLAQQAQAPDTPADSIADLVPVQPLVDDADVAVRLSRILTSTEWFPSVDISVEEGVAFLDGIADSAEHRDWAERLAGKTEGVVAVVNRMELSAEAGPTFSRARGEISTFFQNVFRAWPLVLLVILIFIVTWIAARLVASLARRFFGGRIASPLLTSVIVRTASVPVILLGLYFVLQVAGLTRLAVTVLGGTGLLGIIIGFAFRDIAENFLASLLLSVRNPFRSGDLVEIEGQTGIVQNLNTRTTILLTLDGNHVQIPNAMVYKSTIKNYSSTSTRRAEFMVGIGYDSSASKAQALISRVLNDHPAVQKSPEPLVLVDTLGDAMVNLRIFYWFDSATYSPAKINSALLRLTKNTLMEHGIAMPDPSREILFPQGVPIIQMPRPSEEAGAIAPLEESGEDALAVTTGEGDLSTTETGKAPHARSAEAVPEAAENLLNN